RDWSSDVCSSDLGSFGSLCALRCLPSFDTPSRFVHHPSIPVLAFTKFCAIATSPALSPHSASHAEKAVPVFSFSPAPFSAPSTHTRNSVRQTTFTAQRGHQSPPCQRRREAPAGWL